MAKIDPWQRADLSHTASQGEVLNSSAALGWPGIVVEQRYNPGGEYTFYYPDYHMLCLHQDRPMPIEQVRNGRQQSYIIQPGALQIIPAGTESIWRHRDGSAHTHVLIIPQILEQVAAEMGQRPAEIRDHFSSQDRRIEHISNALLAEALEGGTTGRLYAEGLATALAAHLINTYSGPLKTLPDANKGLPTPLLQRITSLIEDRLSEELGLAELAGEVGLSPSHFASLFRKTTGVSPHQYIVQRRLEHAQRLLSTTRLSIGEIAATVGFYDQSHLVRHMRRVMGVTPTYIRERRS